MASMAEKILPLPDETQVLPGHGGTTTIGWERKTNPFLVELQQRESEGEKAHGGAMRRRVREAPIAERSERRRRAATGHSSARGGT